MSVTYQLTQVEASSSYFFGDIKWSYVIIINVGMFLHLSLQYDTKLKLFELWPENNIWGHRLCLWDVHSDILSTKQVIIQIKMIIDRSTFFLNVQFTCNHSEHFSFFSDIRCPFACFVHSQGTVLTPTMDHAMSIQPTSMMGPLTQQLSHLSLGSTGTVSTNNTHTHKHTIH